MKSRSALQFVVIIGIANFFADFTYEGARGIVGPFLGSLGASAAIVGFVAGLGELMGYGLRSVSGYFADKSHRHWAFAFVGYTVNLLAVPALALATQWPLRVRCFKRCSPALFHHRNEARHLACLIPDTGSRGSLEVRSWDCFTTNQSSRSRYFQ